jgi:hypothetical protein
VGDILDGLLATHPTTAHPIKTKRKWIYSLPFVMPVVRIYDA